MILPASNILQRIFLAVTISSAVGLMVLLLHRADIYDSSWLVPGRLKQTSNVIGMVVEKKIRLACWILTMPANHLSKARNVGLTWGRRCDKLIFVSSNTTPAIDDWPITTVRSEGYYKVWQKTQHAFKYLYAHHGADYDWFLKADDDTYMIIENLRSVLGHYSPDTPIYFGQKYETLNGSKARSRSLG